MNMKELIEIFSGLLTPTIAIIAVYIAYQQLKTNRDRVRLNLYDKRFKVFRGLMDLLAHIMREGNVTDEALYKFNADTNEARFIFDKEIPDYLQTIYEKAVDIQTKNSELHEPNPQEEKRAQLAREVAEIKKWMYRQFKVSREMFGKYLKFKE
jgi:hypothetical protein